MPVFSENNCNLVRGRERDRWFKHYLSIGCSFNKALTLAHKKVR